MFPTGRHAAPRPRRAALLSTAMVGGGSVLTALTALAVLPAAADGDRTGSRATASSAVHGEAAAGSPTAALLRTWQQGSAVDDARRTREAAWTRAAEAAASRQASALRASRARRPAPVPVVTPPPPVRPGVGALTSRYGPRWGRLHAGIDLASAVGSPVNAIADGVVQSAGSEGGYGNVVRVRHGQGTVSLYAHLSEVLVAPGQPVSGGTLLGREGSSGHSTGPHLHFEIRIGDVPVDPLPWLAERGLVLEAPPAQAAG